jgi:hypothetical protein
VEGAKLEARAGVRLPKEFKDGLESDGIDLPLDHPDPPTEATAEGEERLHVVPRCRSVIVAGGAGFLGLNLSPHILGVDLGSGEGTPAGKRGFSRDSRARTIYYVTNPWL